MPEKLTGDVEIIALAVAIAEIAERCWPDLGTDASARIVSNMAKVMKSAMKRARKTANA